MPDEINNPPLYKKGVRSFMSLLDSTTIAKYRALATADGQQAVEATWRLRFIEAQAALADLLDERKGLVAAARSAAWLAHKA
mgnify:CR=1 FL=1